MLHVYSQILAPAFSLLQISQDKDPRLQNL